MADNPAPKKKAKLPPLKGETPVDDDPEKKPVRKKKKKPPSEQTNGSAPADEEATPKKKKPVARADGEKPTPRKRKKKPVSEETSAKEEEPTSARSAESQNEDVTGSKASLISKEGKGAGGPKKKKKKKKAASSGVTPRDEDDWLTAELSTIQEDVVSPSAERDKDEEVVLHPYSTESVILKSQPLDKLFIETNRGFKRENKTVFAKKLAEEEAIREVEPEKPSNTTIAFAIATHKVLMTFCMFIHGITAGLALWHIVMTYILLYFDNIDFIEHYRVLALPVQCLFYFLLVLCTVSACDRNDIGYPTRRWVLQSLTLQTGTIAVVLYLASLICSLCAASLEDKINLYNTYRNLWTNTQRATSAQSYRVYPLWIISHQKKQDEPLGSVGSNIGQWRDLNTARGILAILAWIVLSISPSADRFAENLKQGDDDFLGDSLELNSKPVV